MEKLNRAGGEGWEMIGMVPFTLPSGEVRGAFLLFKREIASDHESGPRLKRGVFSSRSAVLPVRRVRATRPVFDQENCSLCHIRESVFFDTSFLTIEERKAFDEERICDSCHNGSVEDSRAVLWKGAQHPSLPPGKGEGRRCSACHSPT